MVHAIVNRPTTFFVGFALLVGFGLYTANELPVDLFPKIEPAVMMISTRYENAGPEEVERSITRPLESALSNVSNLRRMSSTTTHGNSSIVVEFNWGTNMDEAGNEVRDRIDHIRPLLPDDAGSPSMFKFDPALIPLMELRLVGERSTEELRAIAENSVQPRLEQIPGVAQTFVQGGRDTVIRVDIPRSRLDSYQLSFTEISQALSAQNLNLSAGTLAEGELEYLVQSSGEFRTLEEIERAVLAERGGVPVRLGDLGDVAEGYRRERNRVYINGEPSVYIAVRKQSDANSIQAADAVHAGLRTINSELPPGVRLSVISDTTEIIRSSVATVTGQAAAGALLAVLILFVFLRSLTSTLVVALAIPTSILITLTVMRFAGLTLNIMTLAGLALGVGLLVDNSIVILENIYRHREKGVKLRPAAIRGTREMVGAITAATLTTVSVFLPLTLFRRQLELAGQLFSGLAFTVVISLVSSLVVAVCLVPVLSSHFLPLRTTRQRPLHGFGRRLNDRLSELFLALESVYTTALLSVMRHKVLTVLSVAALFAGSLSLMPRLGFELFPAQEQDNVQLRVRMPLGTRLDVTEQVLFELEELIQSEVAGYKDLVVRAGDGDLFAAGAPHTGRVSILLPEYEHRIESAAEIQARLRPHFDRFPGVELSFGGGGFLGGNGSLGGGPAIDIGIRSNDAEEARRVAESIRDLLEHQVPEVVDPQTNVSDGLPLVDIRVDRERAYALGLTMTTVGREIRANLDGLSASRFRRAGNEYDIVLMLDESDRQQVPDLNRIFVTNNRGERVPLSSFASYERTTGPTTIHRAGQAREIRVQAGLVPGAQISEIEPRIRSLIHEQVRPGDGVVLRFEGDYADMQRYGKVFIAVIVVAVLLVFGVMAAQFESFSDPFIIFFTIPLTLIGVIVIHFVLGIALSLFSAVGFVMLLGIVVNNGIVLVDYTKLLRRRGMQLSEACVAAAANRLRPILMTNLTTVLGLAPLAFFPGEGSELVQPIGVTVIGGLTTSSLLTLFFVPLLYLALNTHTEKWAAARAARLEELCGLTPKVASAP